MVIVGVLLGSFVEPLYVPDVYRLHRV